MPSHNVYHDSIEPLPAHRIVRDESGNRYLESADHLRPLKQSSDSESDSGSIESQSNDNNESSWNERFQRIYNTENSLEKYLALGKLVKDFVDTAQTYVLELSTILNNMFLIATPKSSSPRARCQ